MDHSPSEGATRCENCTRCENASQAEPGWGNCTAGSESCPVAYREPCTLTSPGTCMVCPQPSWALVVVGGPADAAGGVGGSSVCTPCSPGHHYLGDSHSAVASGAVAESERCTPCPPNLYCPGPSKVEACQVRRARVL